MQRKVIIESFLYSGSRYLIMFLGFIRYFYIGSVFTPAMYGAWVIYSTILAYADQMHFGLRHIGDREIPRLLRVGHDQEMRVLIRDLLSGIMIIGSVFFLAMIVSGLLDMKASGDMALGLILVGAIAVSDQVNRFYFMLQRSHNQFLLTSRVESGFEIVKTLLLCFAVTKWFVNGALAALLVSNLGLILYMALSYYHIDVRLFPSLTTVRSLIIKGIPLSLSGMFFIVQSNIDRVVGAFMLSKEQLGLYGMAALIAFTPTMTTQAIGFVASPRLNALYGKSLSNDELLVLFQKVLGMITVLIPVLIMLAGYGGPFVIQKYLPLYLRSVPAIEILLAGAAFFSTAHLVTMLYISLRRNAECILLQTAGLVFSLVLYVVLILSGFRSIEWLAAGTSVSLGVVSIAFLLKASRTAYSPGLALKQMMITVSVIAVGILNIVACNGLMNYLFPKGTAVALFLPLGKIFVYFITYGTIIYLCYKCKLIQLPIVKTDHAAVA